MQNRPPPSRGEVAPGEVLAAEGDDHGSVSPTIQARVISRTIREPSAAEADDTPDAVFDRQTRSQDRDEDDVVDPEDDLQGASA